MGALRSSEINVSQAPKVHFDNSYSIQVFFKENENFYIHQVVTEGEQRIVVSEEPLPDLKPDMRFTLNMSIDELLSQRSIFVEASDIRMMKSPGCDENKALLLLNSLMSLL